MALGRLELLGDSLGCDEGWAERLGDSLGVEDGALLGSADG